MIMSFKNPGNAQEEEIRKKQTDFLNRLDPNEYEMALLEFIMGRIRDTKHGAMVKILPFETPEAAAMALSMSELQTKVN
jgi:hypothetical protein